MKSSRRTPREERPRDPPTIAGRVPPHDLAAEASVLSVVLADGVDGVVDQLRAEHFYSHANAAIYEAALALTLAGVAVDARTVATWLRDRERLQAIGGDAYVQSLAYEAPYKVNIAAYATTVRAKWRLRRLIAECQRIAAEGYGDVGEAGTFIDSAEQAIYDLSRTPESSTMQRASLALTAAIRTISEAAARGEAITGIPTGFERLDAKTSGLHPGELYIVAGRPGMGKTALAMGIVVNVAASRKVTMEDEHGRSREIEVEGFGVGVFSLEMPKEQIALRSACAEAKVDTLRARKGILNAEEWQKLTGASAFFAGLPIWIDDSPVVTLLDVRAKIRRLQSEYNKPATDAAPEKRIGLVVIDYLQLMHGEADSREQEISALSRGLKGLAKELKLPVILLSQLNRTTETRTTKDKRPQLSDLRESGAIEQDADAVIFVYRDEYYFPDTTQAKGIAEIIIAKQRNGPTGKVLLKFTGPFTRFDNLSLSEYPKTADDDD